MTLYKTVPVTEDNLPPVGESLFSDDYLMYKDDEFIGIGFYDRISNQWIGQHGIEKPTHYLLPVGEEKLRRLCEGCYKEGYDRGWWNSGLKDYSNNPSGLYPAITSLIDKFLKDEL